MRTQAIIDSPVWFRFQTPINRIDKGMKLERNAGWAGCDEAGRGPLAGPVTAAAVILPEGFDTTGLNDSKKLSGAQREQLERRIMNEATYAIEFAWPDEIDSKNILWASLAAMQRAVERLQIRPELVAVDGNRLIPGLEFPQEAFVKGDGKIAEIAAASILAKQARDRYMVDISATYPGYGFELHFGYPTPEHLRLLNELGPCAIHRKSFAPVAQYQQASLF